MKLRDYQLNAVNAVRNAIRSGRSAPLLVCPTGGGKTAMGAEIVRSGVERGRRFVWLAHRTELVEQAYDTIRRLGVQAGVVGDSVARARNPQAPVQVCMLPTLLARDLRPTADIAIVDESHHAVADEFHRVVTHYQMRIGLTATPERQDGRGLGNAFDALIPVISIKELTDRGVLVPCTVISPDRKLAPGQIAQSPLDAYRAHCSGRRTIVFAAHVKAAEEHLAEFRAAGVRSELITGETPNRSAILAAYKRGEFDVLVNVFVLTEGFDDPPTSACILARGCGSPGMYLQIVGRILRSSPGKTNAVLVDLRGVTHDPDIGPPDLERVYSLDGKGIRNAETDNLRFCQRCSSPMGLDDTKCPMCGWEPRQELEAPTVVGAQLKPYVRLRSDAPDKRAERLARWMLDGRGRGYKPGWAFGKYRAVYGDAPSGLVRTAAMRIASGASRAHNDNGATPVPLSLAGGAEE